MIDINFDCLGNSKKIQLNSFIKDSLNKSLDEIDNNKKNIYVSVFLTNNKKIKEINKKYRSINKVTSCAVKLNVNIIDLKINKRSEDFFEIEVSIQVSNIKHFNDFLFALKLEETIYKVERI